ncbi:biotin-protein ligase [Sporolactobacillus inulinus]|uniref:Biotin-protein ligase n=1 Tax=Sporolactobacillus inulinus TaxID=2078 RepID=A0A4Y1ZAH3_9BACL|nr:hypothetical protein [Sporolactobacillus inulinus]GAY76040.1 biotin-protein ligase [Sporolactobacillus inulinus]
MAEATYVKAVVIGIGFNVNTTAFPDPIKSGAASLASLTGKQFALAPIVQQFFASFETLYALYLSEGFKRIRPLWEKRALNLGKQIKVVSLGDAFSLVRHWGLMITASCN